MEDFLYRDNGGKLLTSREFDELSISEIETRGIRLYYFLS
jgi:hypothetical protein